MLPLGTIESPEIVIGLVGRIGLDTRLVSEKIKSVLSTYSYETKILKVTSLLPKLKALPTIIDRERTLRTANGQLALAGADSPPIRPCRVLKVAATTSSKSP
jgi:hypothetical protein